MTFTPSQLLPYLPTPAVGSRWWVAFSGGLDSTVLLHALAQLALPVKLHALHVNHQISPNAARWQAHCEAFAASVGAVFYGEKVVVRNTGRGIEDAARQARYGVFERYLAKGDMLLCAHHGDDQAETLLLRLLRGTGPRGLAAMARQRTLGQGVLVRPLLDVSRAELEQYARAHQLLWVEDESNQDERYDRNFLRSQIMPLLHSRWPGFIAKWQQTAQLCAANEQLLEEVACEDLPRLQPRAERLGHSVALTDWLALSEPRRLNVLRYWLRSLQFALPEQVHLQQLQQQLAAGGDDAHIHITWANISLRVYRQRLYAINRDQPQPVLHMLPQRQGAGRLCGALPGLQVRPRVGGERCTPQGRGHSQTLKKLLQEVALEPWLREGLPLIYSGETLVAVADLWLCEGCEAQEGEPGFMVHWR